MYDLLIYSWHIEGFTEGGHHSPYTMLVGIALKDITAEYEGNICIHPGSNVMLHELVKNQVTHKKMFLCNYNFISTITFYNCRLRFAAKLSLSLARVPVARLIWESPRRSDSSLQIIVLL